MTVRHHIDRLDALVRDARKRPILGGVRIDRDELVEIVDDLSEELDAQVTRLDDGRVVRRAAGVHGPMIELVGLTLSDRSHFDREQLLGIVERMRAGAHREEIVEPSSYDSTAARALVDELEQLLQSAAPVPLTDEVRLEKEEIYDVLDRLRAEFADAVTAADEPTKARLGELLPLVDELDDRIHNAKPVPLTSQVRVELRKLSAIVKRMRAAFVQGTLAALTN